MLFNSEMWYNCQSEDVGRFSIMRCGTILNKKMWNVCQLWDIVYHWKYINSEMWFDCQQGDMTVSLISMCGLIDSNISKTW